MSGFPKLIWRQGGKHPIAEIWWERDITREGKKITTLAEHPLDNADIALGFAALCEKFPPPKQERKAS